MSYKTGNFSVENVKYIYSFLRLNYESSHTAFSFHVNILGESSPCIVIYRSINKYDCSLHCRIGEKKLKITSMKEFKVEAIKYLTNS
jgi:hypothetical protein